METTQASWPADLDAVFKALGKAMGEGRLRPEVLGLLPSGPGAIITGHTVLITHRSGRDLGQKRGRYQIDLTGDRWIDGGRWLFWSGDLEKLARHS